MPSVITALFCNEAPTSGDWTTWGGWKFGGARVSAILFYYYTKFFFVIFSIFGSFLFFFLLSMSFLMLFWLVLDFF